MPRWIIYYERSLAQKVSQEVKDALLDGSEAITDQTSPAEKAAWAGQAMVRIDGTLSEPLRREILEDCGKQCIGASILEKAARIRRAAPDLENFLVGLNQSHIGGGTLIYAGGAIHATYSRCYCGMINGRRALISPTYCNCSRGWFLKLFETVLKTPIKVELEQSIAQGAPDCRFRITLPASFSWQP